MDNNLMKKIKILKKQKLKNINSNKCILTHKLIETIMVNKI